MEDESGLTEADKLGGSDGDYNNDGIGTATKIVRGGSWYSQKSSSQSFRRSETRAAGSGCCHSVGFRVAVLNPSRASLGIALPAGGSATVSTAGSEDSAQVGYATATVASGITPYGVAVFSFKQNDVVASEAGVPPSPPSTSARIFVDYRDGVRAAPARTEAHPVDVNTGLALVN